MKQLKLAACDFGQRDCPPDQGRVHRLVGPDQIRAEYDQRFFDFCLVWHRRNLLVLGFTTYDANHMPMPKTRPRRPVYMALLSFFAEIAEI
jgi:hypothetical protein